MSANVCNIFRPWKSSTQLIADVLFAQDLGTVRKELSHKPGFSSLLIQRLRGWYWWSHDQMPGGGLIYLWFIKTQTKMKALIIIVTACILTSCAMQSHCPTYAGTKRQTNH